MHTSPCKRRRERDAVVDATPTAAPCRGHENTPLTRLTRPPSLDALLCRTGQHSRSVCEASMGVCSCTVRKRGHAFDLRSRAHLEVFSSLLLKTPQRKQRGQRRPIDGRILSRTRSRTRLVSEGRMRAAAYVVDSRCKACERLVCMPLCIIMMCEASMKQVKAAHQQRP